MADIETLIKQLNDSDNNIQSEASKALTALGLSAVAPLLEGLKTSNGRARMRMVSLLIGTGDEKVLPVLLSLINDSEQSVRHVLATSLGRFGKNPMTIEALQKLAESDPVSGIRQAAAYTLEKQIQAPNMLPLLIKQMNDADVFVSMNAIEAIGKQGTEEAITALLGALNTVSPNRSGVIVIALGKTRSPRAFEPILPFLKAEKPSVRAATATALGEIGNRQAVPYIQPLLKDTAIAYKGEYSGPDQTVADVAQKALQSLS